METIETVNREKIYERIKALTDEDLAAVETFLSHLAESKDFGRESLECVLLSQSTLRRELDTPEEDEAWRYLAEEA
ncbi:DUF2281 domain-containing protein [Thermodesulfobacteriota bacterium]